MYLKIILNDSIKKNNITLDAEYFISSKEVLYHQKLEKQLLNELELHIQLYKQCLDFGRIVENIIAEQFIQGLRKLEKQFLDNFKNELNKYLFRDLNLNDINLFASSLWGVWFLELFADVYITETNKKTVLTYTTHDVVNHITKRFCAFCLFFDEDFSLSSKDEKILQRIVLKLLHALVSQQLVTKKLTYEYDKTIKSIYLYSFEVKASLNFNLYHLKINLTSPTIFINRATPFAKNLTYLSVSKIMLLSEGNLKEFKLKELNLLHKLFATSYVVDLHYYYEIYDYVLANTPTTLIEDTCDWKWNVKETTLGAYWYNLIFLNMAPWLPWLVGGFYWNYVFDFRGRLYIDSIVSYQSAKIFRHLYGYANLIEVNTNKSIIKDIAKYINQISTETSFVKDYPNIDLKKYDKELFWLFVEIAKLFKNELLDHDKYYLTTEGLINCALTNYTTDIRKLEFEKQLELLFIKNVFKKLNEGLVFNFIIFKDATASALQLLTLVLNVKNKELIQIFNLNSRDTWYDPYTYIIGLFLIENKIETEYFKYFNRKYLKKTIMTYNYSATLYTCMQNFYEEVKIKSLPGGERKIITEYFINFYKFLEQLFNNKNFFEASLTTINTKLLDILVKENALVLYLNDESYAFLHYYTKQGKRLNFKPKGGDRTTTMFWSLTQYLDVKKTSSALKPNTIHALDAALVRLTIYNNPYTIATIHDSFGAPLYDIENIINLVNKNLNLVYYRAQDVEWYTENKQYYSVYVIF